MQLVAPDLLVAEIGNIVWKKHRLQGLSLADAQLIIDGFRAVQFPLVPMADLLNDAFRLAVTHQRTVYDMMYLALGQKRTCRIVTADEKMVNAVGSLFPKLSWIANWP